MSAARAREGQRVAWGLGREAVGQVIDASAIGERQLLRVRGEDGTGRTILAGPNGDGGMKVLEVFGGAEVRRLARLILMDAAPRMPLNMKLKVLAAAVLAPPVDDEPPEAGR